MITSDGAIEIHLLAEGTCERAAKSALLPEFDLVVRCLRDASTQTAAVQSFLAALRASSS